MAKTQYYSGEIQYVEHVVVRMTIGITSTRGKRGDIEIDLTSPNGTNSTLLRMRPLDDSTEGYDDWSFMSVMFWGENPNGDWTLTIRSMKNSTNITISGIEFTFYGVSQVPEAVANIPDQCHSNCSRGCAREGSDFCDSCVNLSNAYTLECIDECPSGYTNRSGYCYDATQDPPECNSLLKTKLTGLLYWIGALGSNILFP